MASPALSYQSVLVHVGLDLIGDGLLKLPFLRALRESLPEARVTWVCGKGKSVFSGPLAPAVAGLIDEVIETAHIGESWCELFGPKPLSGRGFDLIIDSQSGPLPTLMLRRLPHRRLVSRALRYALSDRRPSGKAKSAAQTNRMLREMLDLLELAIEHPIETPTESLLPIPPDIAAAAETAYGKGTPIIGLAPGAGGRHKCWPLDRFIALAQGEIIRGRRPAFLLGPAEVEWRDPLAQAVPEALFPLQDSQVAQQFGLTPFVTVALCRPMAAVVCNDAGVGHLAAASGVPLVVLYGPTSPRKFAPLAKKSLFLCAQDHGGAAMSDIPLASVEHAIETLIR